MLHPRLTPVNGGNPVWLGEIGTYGTWGDLSIMSRWGDGASGMYEATWTMPLPADFDSAITRRGSLVEMFRNGFRIGCPLVLSEPTKGTGLDSPWTFTCTGIGRDVEGNDAFTAFDGSTNSTAIPSTAVDQAIIRGWRIAGRAASVPTTAVGVDPPEGLNSVGSLLNAAGEKLGQRWGVDRTNTLFFAADPTTPSYQVEPDTITLGTSDENYATVVYGVYLDTVTKAYLKVTASNANVATVFGRKEYNADLTVLGAITTATAQSYVDGILARTKGRLAYTNTLTLSPQQLLTMGGTPADLTKVVKDVGEGCMIRLHGINSDLLAYNQATYLDIVIAEAKLTDGEDQIQLAPIGLAARDIARIQEEVTSMVMSA